jgi:transcriptional regulator with XRE-family HTH domain
MDQVKSGAFIAQIRREKGWIQEELGERRGVTNKTVSRWENGNYMPIRDIAPRDGGLLTYEFIDGFPFFIGEETSHNAAP